VTKHVPQAERSKEEASANIDRKIEVLRSWVKDGIPYLENPNGHFIVDNKDHKLLDYYPTSLRNFKEWDGSRNCDAVRVTLPKMSRIGNDTLSKRPDREHIVREILAGLRLRAEEQLLAGRHAELRRLEYGISALESLLKIRQSEFRTLRLDLIRERKDHQNLLDRHKRVVEKYSESFAKKDAEIERLKRANADLVSQINKVRPIKSVIGDDKQ